MPVARADFPVECVETAAAICANAEGALNYVSLHAFVRDMSPRPFSTLEAAASSLGRIARDTNVVLLVTLTSAGAAASLVAKYRPSVPQARRVTCLHAMCAVRI
jgi:pyruvate kinase